MKRSLFHALLGLALLGLAACSQLSMENYEKLKLGMSYDEVKAVLGKPAGCSEQLLVKTCTWGDEQTGVSASFVADKLVNRSAKNLK